MTILCVASTGGHLVELLHLESRFAFGDKDRLWITFEGKESRSALSGRKALFVSGIGEKDLIGTFKCFRTANRIISEYVPSAVVSTGSAIAVPFLTVAALRNIPSHYIESAARVSEPSLTGRLLSLNTGVKLYSQYGSGMRGRWVYLGSAFADYETGAKRRKTMSDIKSIVVTLGTMKYGYRRLVAHLVSLIPPNINVFWQTGSTAVDGLGIEAHAVVPAAELAQKIAIADVVVGHAGCGTALTALGAKKCPILVPRDPELGEIYDDHQSEIGRFLNNKAIAICRQPEEITLDDFLEAASRTVKSARKYTSLHLV